VPGSGRHGKRWQDVLDILGAGINVITTVSSGDPRSGPSLNPAAIVAALNRHQIRHVVIGAFAAIAQQAPIPATRDIDFTPDVSQENVARLSLALTDLGARIRTEAVPDGLPFSQGATSLAAAEAWNLVCADGEFDIFFYPSGFAGGYTAGYEWLPTHDEDWHRAWRRRLRCGAADGSGQSASPTC
jgi:hypothetical protein